MMLALNQFQPSIQSYIPDSRVETEEDYIGSDVVDNLNIDDQPKPKKQIRISEFLAKEKEKHEVKMKSVHDHLSNAENDIEYSNQAENYYQNSYDDDDESLGDNYNEFLGENIEAKSNDNHLTTIEKGESLDHISVDDGNVRQENVSFYQNGDLDKDSNNNVKEFVNQSQEDNDEFNLLADDLESTNYSADNEKVDYQDTDGLEDNIVDEYPEDKDDIPKEYSNYGDQDQLTKFDRSLMTDSDTQEHTGTVLAKPAEPTDENINGITQLDYGIISEREEQHYRLVLGLESLSSFYGNVCDEIKDFLRVNFEASSEFDDDQLIDITVYMLPKAKKLLSGIEAQTGFILNNCKNANTNENKSQIDITQQMSATARQIENRRKFMSYLKKHDIKKKISNQNYEINIDLSEEFMLGFSELMKSVTDVCQTYVWFLDDFFGAQSEDSTEGGRALIKKAIDVFDSEKEFRSEIEPSLFVMQDLKYCLNNFKFVPSRS